MKYNVGLIVTKKYEYQINFSSQERFFDYISDTPNVLWARLFERETGKVLSVYGIENESKKVTPICDLCSERNCPIASMSIFHCKDFTKE